MFTIAGETLLAAVLVSPLLAPPLPCEPPEVASSFGGVVPRPPTAPFHAGAFALYELEWSRIDDPARPTSSPPATATAATSATARFEWWRGARGAAAGGAPKG